MFGAKILAPNQETKTETIGNSQMVGTEASEREDYFAEGENCLLTRGGLISGSALLLHLIAEASRQGDRQVMTIVDLQTEPAAELFLARHGFTKTESLISIEADLEPMRQRMAALRDRLLVGDKIPSSARTVCLSRENRPEALRLYNDHVMRNRYMNPEWVYPAEDNERFAHSQVLLLDGRVIGILLSELEGETGKASALAIDPAYRSGWAAPYLLSAGMDRVAAAGARRIRFDFIESNNMMQKLAARFQATTVAVLGQFIHFIE